MVRLFSLSFALLLVGCVLLSGFLRSVCGNGITEEPNETCDGTPDCNEQCQFSVCGNAILENGEGCDDGNDVNGDSCSIFCRNELLCGNGAPDTGEECDDGNSIATDDCTTLCSLARCRDGFVQAGVEECDDGNNNPGDGCRPDCTIEACSDGSIDPGELCLGIQTVTLPTLPNPNRIAARDLNGDGHLDMVVASKDPATLQIFSGDGTGNFMPLVTFLISTASEVGGLTILDLNEDSQLDIAAVFNTVSSNIGFLVIALQTAGDNFALSEINTVDIGIASRDIVGEDLSDDGAPELLIASSLDGGLRALNNAGDGVTYTPGISFPSLAGSFGLALADFNQDGLLDLVNIGEGATSANLYLRASENSFQPPASISLGFSCLFVVAADFNDDSRPDFATSCLGNSLLVVLTQNTDGTFSSAFLGTPSPGSLVAKDINADNLLDLIVANQNNASISFFLNAAGTFGANVQILTAAILPTSILVADINEDGAPDVIAADLQGASLSLFFADP